MLFHEIQKTHGENIVLRWRSNGDVEVVKTGNPDIDAMPREMRAITEEYQRIHKNRHEILFEILTTTPAIRQSIEENPNPFIRRINSMLKRRLLSARKIAHEIYLKLLITNVLLKANPQKAVQTIWRFIENYPDTKCLMTGDKLYVIYARTTRLTRQFRKELQKRPHLVVLETPILFHALNQFVFKITQEHQSDRSTNELVIHALAQYQQRLSQYLDGSLPWNNETVEKARLVFERQIKPILKHCEEVYRHDRMFVTLYRTAFQTLGLYQKLEEAYERRVKMI